MFPHLLQGMEDEFVVDRPGKDVGDQGPIIHPHVGDPVLGRTGQVRPHEDGILWLAGPGGLKAWEWAKDTFDQLGIPYAGVIMHHDRGSAFISYMWTSQLLLDDGVWLSYALRGAKDNPAMESFNGRFKGEGYSLFLNAQTLDEFIKVVDQRMTYYNIERRHSSIGYVPPMAYIERVRPGLKK